MENKKLGRILDDITIRDIVIDGFKIILTVSFICATITAALSTIALIIMWVF